jgi:DNA-binding transcriptional ArsR family regulator
MDDLEQLRATAHPIRLRVLSLLTGTAMSAAEVGRELGISQASASYHLRLLERSGLIRVTEQVKLRGGLAKRYRHESSSEPFDLGGQTDAGRGDSAGGPAHDDYYAALAVELRRRATMRADGPRVSTDAELWLDPDEWAAIVTAIGDASARLHAAALPPRAPGSVRVSMSAALFTMSPAPSPDGQPQ